MTFDPNFLALLVPASLALNFYPGPNNVFALSNAARFGVAEAARAALGRLVAYALLVVMLAGGLGALFISSPIVFAVLRLAGAAFLLWLGIKMLRQPMISGGASGGAVAPLDRRALAMDEFRVAFANPKPVIVLLPFLPQLVTPGAAVSGGIALAGALVLALEMGAAFSYAMVGARARRIAETDGGRRAISWAGGVSVIITATLLALTGAR